MKILVPEQIERDIIKSSSMHQIENGIKLVRSSHAPREMIAEIVENLEAKMIELALRPLFTSQNTLNN